MSAILVGVSRDMDGKVLSRCKYAFPFKTPQLKEEDEVRYLYVRRCKEDSLVVLYNLEILLFGELL